MVPRSTPIPHQAKVEYKKKVERQLENNNTKEVWRGMRTIKARQGKFIYKAQFVHKAIQSALQLYKIRRRKIKSFHKNVLKINKLIN